MIRSERRENEPVQPRVVVATGECGAQTGRSPADPADGSDTYLPAATPGMQHRLTVRRGRDHVLLRLRALEPPLGAVRVVRHGTSEPSKSASSSRPPTVAVERHWRPASEEIPEKPAETPSSTTVAAAAAASLSAEEDRRLSVRKRRQETQARVDAIRRGEIAPPPLPVPPRPVPRPSSQPSQAPVAEPEPQQPPQQKKPPVPRLSDRSRGGAPVPAEKKPAPQASAEARARPQASRQGHTASSNTRVAVVAPVTMVPPVGAASQVTHPVVRVVREESAPATAATGPATIASGDIQRDRPPSPAQNRPEVRLSPSRPPAVSNPSPAVAGPPTSPAAAAAAVADAAEAAAAEADAAMAEAAPDRREEEPTGPLVEQASDYLPRLEDKASWVAEHEERVAEWREQSRRHADEVRRRREALDEEQTQSRARNAEWTHERQQRSEMLRRANQLLRMQYGHEYQYYSHSHAHPHPRPDHGGAPASPPPPASPRAAPPRRREDRTGARDPALQRQVARTLMGLERGGHPHPAARSPRREHSDGHSPRGGDKSAAPESRVASGPANRTSTVSGFDYAAMEARIGGLASERVRLGAGSLLVDDAQLEELSKRSASAAVQNEHVDQATGAATAAVLLSRSTMPPMDVDLVEEAAPGGGAGQHSLALENVTPAEGLRLRLLRTVGDPSFAAEREQIKKLAEEEAGAKLAAALKQSKGTARSGLPSRTAARARAHSVAATAAVASPGDGTAAPTDPPGPRARSARAAAPTVSPVDDEATRAEAGHSVLDPLLGGGTVPAFRLRAVPPPAPIPAGFVPRRSYFRPPELQRPERPLPKQADVPEASSGSPSAREAADVLGQPRVVAQAVPVAVVADLLPFEPPARPVPLAVPERKTRRTLRIVEDDSSSENGSSSDEQRGRRSRSSRRRRPGRSQERSRSPVRSPPAAADEPAAVVVRREADERTERLLRRIPVRVPRRFDVMSAYPVPDPASVLSPPGPVVRPSAEENAMLSLVLNLLTAPPEERGEALADATPGATVAARGPALAAPAPSAVQVVHSPADRVRVVVAVEPDLQTGNPAVHVRIVLNPRLGPLLENEERLRQAHAEALRKREEAEAARQRLAEEAERAQRAREEAERARQAEAEQQLAMRARLALLEELRELELLAARHERLRVEEETAALRREAAMMSRPNPVRVVLQRRKQAEDGGGQAVRVRIFRAGEVPFDDDVVPPAAATAGSALGYCETPEDAGLAAVRLGRPAPILPRPPQLVRLRFSVERGGRVATSIRVLGSGRTFSSAAATLATKRLKRGSSPRRRVRRPGSPGQRVRLSIDPVGPTAAGGRPAVRVNIRPVEGGDEEWDGSGPDDGDEMPEFDEVGRASAMYHQQAEVLNQLRQEVSDLRKKVLAGALAPSPRRRHHRGKREREDGGMAYWANRLEVLGGPKVVLSSPSSSAASSRSSSSSSAAGQENRGATVRHHHRTSADRRGGARDSGRRSRRRDDGDEDANYDPYNLSDSFEDRLDHWKGVWEDPARAMLSDGELDTSGVMELPLPERAKWLAEAGGSGSDEDNIVRTRQRRRAAALAARGPGQVPAAGRGGVVVGPDGSRPAPYLTFDAAATAVPWKPRAVVSGTVVVPERVRSPNISDGEIVRE